MKLSKIRDSIGKDAIEFDLGENDVAMAFVGTDVKDDTMNVKAYVEGNPERLTVLLTHCMTMNEEFCKVVVNAVRLHNLRVMSETLEQSGGEEIIHS